MARLWSLLRCLKRQVIFFYFNIKKTVLKLFNSIFTYIFHSFFFEGKNDFLMYVAKLGKLTLALFFFPCLEHLFHYYFTVKHPIIDHAVTIKHYNKIKTMLILT